MTTVSGYSSFMCTTNVLGIILKMKLYLNSGRGSERVISRAVEIRWRWVCRNYLRRVDGLYVIAAHRIDMGADVGCWKRRRTIVRS